MAGAFRRSAALQAMTALSVLALVVPDQVQGKGKCPSFSCGRLSNGLAPFRRQGDPAECGVPSYELTCADSNATIQIDKATYLVTDINYMDQYFWVIDASLDSANNCPLPRWSQTPYNENYRLGEDSHRRVQVQLSPDVDWFATFVKCSQEMNSSNVMYRPVACRSSNSSFVYVLTGLGSYLAENLEPSCGYLAMTPLAVGGLENWRTATAAVTLEDVDYEDVVRSMREGFAVRFPFRSGGFIDCLRGMISDSSGEPPVYRVFHIVAHIDSYFSICGRQATQLPHPFVVLLMLVPQTLWIFCHALFVHTLGLYSRDEPVYGVACRFVMVMLLLWTSLAYLYWKIRMRVDEVEKFLRMQQMLTPTRYTYTDITAITSHFRDKLGQGGYGSVYKGVLLPGDVGVAIKMLKGDSNCKGEEFISEVSTIGRIHHVNVVRLVGFCSEEMRRALVYEYMPQGSLDKYIFSSEKSFSWDKLNEIALGIARGINYLHQGCEMQILHFDIKPHNILLDNNFVPKVADFGLAKLYPRDKSFVPVSAARGTVEYIAPEMISRSFGAISSKSDVYSFGMLLLEMAGGRRNADPNAENSSQAYYPSRVYRQLTRQVIYKIDQTWAKFQQQETGEITSAGDMHELEKKLCIVGLWCIQMKSCDRPMMSEVIEMLEVGVDCLEIPPRPFFCDDDYIPAVESLYLSSWAELAAVSESEETLRRQCALPGLCVAFSGPSSLCYPSHKSRPQARCHAEPQDSHKTRTRGGLVVNWLSCSSRMNQDSIANAATKSDKSVMPEGNVIPMDSATETVDDELLKRAWRRGVDRRDDVQNGLLVIYGGDLARPQKWVMVCNAMEAAALSTVLCVVALVVADADHHVVHVQGRRHPCQPFSCGHLSNISHPFRRRGDPRGCGVRSYELDCSSDDGKATVRINTGTYYVSSINYAASIFWVVDANLQDDANSSCPLPRSDQLPYVGQGIPGSHDSWDLGLNDETRWFGFVNCSQELITNSSSKYLPVNCLTTTSSFVYYMLSWSGAPSIEDIEPSCGYLAMTPIGGGSIDLLAGSDDNPLPKVGIKVRIIDILSIDLRFWGCMIGISRRYYLDVRLSISDMIHGVDNSLYHKLFIIYTLCLVKWIAVLCRFVFAPLAVMIFLTHKYWKTRIAIDAVEKFLRMQDVLGPKRYAYADIIAITSHFRDKLGQGGYGSVYKGVLLPGDVHVAVKMLDGNSNCKGEDFISEVATIGRIHHINVVRLVGFCSEEMRRALLYEYMPKGSLDKYIFSSERSFSWDKLNEIALGIAKGINYLHQGCDMQILHFDIKPHNILLDDNFVPKVADFGLAKLYPRDKSFVSDRALRGTVGYMAPEMVSRSFGVISGKSDVYSFGMLLLEMAGGRRNADPNADSSASKAYYPAWVYDQLIADEQVDEISNVAGMHELERKLCLVGLWCIQMKSHDRPTMSEAIEMLEGGVDALQVPPRPFFCDGDGIGNGMPPPQVMDSYFHSSQLTAISEEDDGIAELATIIIPFSLSLSQKNKKKEKKKKPFSYLRPPPLFPARAPVNAAAASAAAFRLRR
uniref:Protein kinase domain-containing protein n=1 Tax=Oryza punctata TaxID=4537 RepID=A0A0E0JDC1_ORYPU